MINQNKEIEYLSYHGGRSYLKSRRAKKNKIFLIKVIALSLIILGASLFIKNKVSEFNSPVYIQDRYIDCVNLGDCEDLTSSESVIDIKEVAPKGTSKLGELVVHRGVYINSKILEAIDAKFTPEEAKKLKVIMLAECAHDYKIDGVKTYECKSTTENYNKDSKTWDCGYLQINSKEKCSGKHFAIDYQIESAYNKLHSLNGEYCGGFKCWSSYKFKDSKVINSAYNFWASK